LRLEQGWPHHSIRSSFVRSARFARKDGPEGPSPHVLLGFAEDEFSCGGAAFVVGLD